MGKTATNIVTILGVVTIVYAGYFFYSKGTFTSSSFEENEQTKKDMLNRTQAFIEYESVLNGLALDFSFFEDDRLLSLRSYSTPLKPVAVGRENPFADVVNNDSDDVDDFSE